MRRKYEDNRKNGWGWIWYLIITILLILVVLSIRSLEKKNKESSDALFSEINDLKNYTLSFISRFSPQPRTTFY